LCIFLLFGKTIFLGSLERWCGVVRRALALDSLLRQFKVAEPLGPRVPPSSPACLDPVHAAARPGSGEVLKTLADGEIPAPRHSGQREQFRQIIQTELNKTKWAKDSSRSFFKADTQTRDKHVKTGSVSLITRELG
jgi:hypothetical protein